MTQAEACNALRDLAENAAVWTSALTIARQRIKELVQVGCAGLPADEVAYFEEVLVGGFDNEWQYSREYFHETCQGIANCEKASEPGFDGDTYLATAASIDRYGRAARIAIDFAERTAALIAASRHRPDNDSPRADLTGHRF